MYGRIGQRYEFEATVQGFSNDLRHICLESIIYSDGVNFERCHNWLPYQMKWKRLELRVADRIAFSAKINRYYYCEPNQPLGGGETKLELTNIREIVRLGDD